MIGECFGLALGGACLLSGGWSAAPRPPAAFPPAPFRAPAATLPFLVSIERGAQPERVRAPRVDLEAVQEDPAVSRTELTTDGPISPIFFVDTGATRDFAGRVIQPTAAGVGLGWRVTPDLSASMLSSYEVSAGPVTPRGAVQVGFLLRFAR